jgi:hypothetical protein
MLFGSPPHNIKTSQRVSLFQDGPLLEQGAATGGESVPADVG